MKKQGIFYTIIFSFFVTLFCVSLLAVTNELTKERVKENREIVLKKALLNSFQIRFKNEKDILTQYNSRIKKEPTENKIIYSAIDKGQKYYAIVFSGNGLWGTISGVLAVDQQFERITGVDIISHNETPGLGGRIDEQSFKEQFAGEKIVNNRIIIKSSGGIDENHENGSIDAITGATRTSGLLEIIINENLLRLKQFLESNNE